ncbi:MAG: S26 family signal peptidase [bacterium]|nr:S26 family signal peptidase [bacterium]
MGNYIFLVLVLASFFGLSKLFVKAGAEGWKAWVPIYNFYILAKLLEKPWWWCLIMVVPGVNIIMYGVYGFNVARAFNKLSNSDMFLAIVLPYISFVKIGYDPAAKFSGLSKYKLEPNKFIKNWVDPIIFAVIAASIIRGYFIEAFTIPTSSLEKSLMVGDFLFVNKFAYGPKIPQTPLSFPFAHHTLPFSETRKSYLEWIKLPYFRLPGFGHVKNNQIVVFNYPDGDTVLLSHQNSSYYQIVRDEAQTIKGYDSGKQPDAYYQGEAWKQINGPEKPYGNIVARPVDKRDHYVKRCVGIAGDKFEVRSGSVFINNKEQVMPEHAQHRYVVRTNGTIFGENSVTAENTHALSNFRLLDELDIYVSEAGKVGESADTCYYDLNMPVDVAEKVKMIPGVYTVSKKTEPLNYYDYRVFPHNPVYSWNNDNFGPLQIPKAGMTLPIDTHNLCLYQKIMNTYDDGIHEVVAMNGKVLYDGQAISSYTFKQDYYFMMGDNRHNSADSRSWGFVPYDHVVGSPFFVWFSMKYADNNPISGKSVVGSLFKNSKNGKFRWERFLCYVEDGKLHSIKIPFLLTIFGIWGYSKWNHRRKLKLQKASNK